MKSRITAFILVILALARTDNTNAQYINDINPELLKEQWKAKWITCPGISGIEYGVYLFRKNLTINTEYKKFIVHVSADNRYKLYVNNRYVGNGPARGDFMKWYFETVDLGPYLKKGENVIAAEVWNFADDRPMAQFTYQTRFIMQGNSPMENVANSDSTWMVLKDTAYSPLRIDINQYYVVGPGEKFICENHPWGWKNNKYRANGWFHAKEAEPGKPIGCYHEYGEPSPLTLYPRDIPAMETKMQRFKAVRRSDIPQIPPSFLQGENILTIPANSKVKILFDQSFLTTAYPVLHLSMGKKSVIKLTYAESLVDDKLEKGNRNEVENKKIIGNYDIIISAGMADQIYQTLWWRTFRYIEMEVETQDESLVIQDFYSISTGYPFVEKASFKCDDTSFTKIWNAGWRTQRLCAGETFFDCPYYEQLQYVGDSRIQALVSSSVSGDTRLMRNAISAFRNSCLPFGLTQSRYPSTGVQIIPTFSFVWVTMVYDYWMMCNDKVFVRSMIPAIMDVLNWFESKADSSQMAGNLEWWNFVDWVNHKNWVAGSPPGAKDGYSSIINLQFVYTMQKASELLEAFELEKEAARYLELADRIKRAVYKSCYDSQKGLIADTPDKNSFSQHANLFAVLTNTCPKESQKKLIENILSDNDIAQCTLYFRYYLAEAVMQAGLADMYTKMLDPWNQMLDLGLTTFAETPDPTRSDCHAWSASPVYHFLSLICGIKPNEPGFNTVRIEPHLGNLNWIEASMPHRLGMIKVSLKKDGHKHLIGKIVLPENLTGLFSWNGENKPLKDGINIIRI